MQDPNGLSYCETCGVEIDGLKSKKCKKCEFDTIQNFVREGYGGVLKNGNIVDRRIHPEAMPLQKNALLGIPKSK